MAARKRAAAKKTSRRRSATRSESPADGVHEAQGKDVGTLGVDVFEAQGKDVGEGVLQADDEQ
jgi:hypothetical protein